MPSPFYLHTHAAELAAKLGLNCPPLSPALWLERYIAQLELPQVLSMVWAVWWDALATKRVVSSAVWVRA